MPLAPSVLLLDDGELDEAKEVLEELEVEFVHLSGAQIAAEIERPRDLLITSRARAFNLAGSDDSAADAQGPVLICIHNQDFLPFRDRLRELGVHYLVHSAVDRESLRLLLLHALYRGPQKRNAPRLPVGSRVCFKVGPRWQPATLTELSTEGCRLVSTHRPTPGKPITVHLLPDLGGGSLLELRGSVIRVQLDPHGKELGQVLIAISFDDNAPESQERLRTILEGRVIGSLVTRLRESDSEPGAHDEGDGSKTSDAVGAPDEGPEAPEDSAAPAGSTEEFEVVIDPRERVRASYPCPIPAVIGNAPRIILGRDLSVQGMRVEPHPDLELGSTVRVALYGGEGEEPLTLDATVTRDDGDRGLLLRFTDLPDKAAELLELLVTRLPSLESLTRTPTGGRGLIVSTIIPLE
jgi:hypothetical protein